MAGRRLIVNVGGPLVLAAGLAVIGPYGTYDQLSLPLRLLYWGSIVGLNWGQMLLCGMAARRLLPPPRGTPMTVAALAACAASLPAAGEVMLLENWLRPGGMATAGIGFAELYFLVLVITLPVALLLRRRTVAGEETAVMTMPESVAKPGAPPAFLDRLPQRLGRELLCVRTEDHYLRVTTPLGDDLILMRMADAEMELAGADGLRVHRSWWVARAAVAQVERLAGNKMVLVLRSGLRVPVSRTYLGSVRAAGWEV